MLNNINNFGMNPMLMNNMGMNPMIMNNMGMNNQPNITDENALRIKNIIQPYENKIKELEEIIRQKDFEIAILKDTINNNGINMQCQNNIYNMNVNHLDMMMNNVNQEENNKEEEITVSFMNYMDIIMPKKCTCFKNDFTYKLIDKYDQIQDGI